MKNKFMLELSRRLLPFANFGEMKEILGDYSGFMVDSQVHEKPKDIVKSLELQKTKGFITGILFILFWWIFGCVNTWATTAWDEPFYFSGAVVILFSVVGLFVLFSVLGKKLALVSQYSGNRKFMQKSNVVLSALMISGITAFIGWLVLTFIYPPEYKEPERVGLFIDLIYNIVCIFAVTNLLVFLIKGSAYFLSSGVSFVAMNIFTVLEIFLSSISSFDNFIFTYLFIVLAAFFIQVIVVGILNSKLKKVIKE